MRVSFAPLSVKEFNVLFKDDDDGMNSRGGGISDISVYVPKSNRGGSLFQILGKLAKSAAPLLMRTVVPEGINFAKNVIGDISSGQKLKQSLKKRGIESLKELGRKIVRGGGKKRRRKNERVVKRLTMKKKKRKTSKREDRYNDIFSQM